MNTKTVKVGDSIRARLALNGTISYAGQLGLVGVNLVSFITFKLYGKAIFPNRWSVFPVEVADIFAITKDELKMITGYSYPWDRMEIKVGKRYITLDKYFNK